MIMGNLICLIGRHGAGKSSIGLFLAKQGYVHLSLGLLRRLATAGKYPSDIPVSLMLSIRRMRPAMPLPTDVIRKLLAHASGCERCVIDGFPTSIEHLSILPKSTKIVYVWTPTLSRMERLRKRADNSQRQWTTGLSSHRDHSLPYLLREMRKRGSFRFISNRLDGAEEVEQLANNIANL